MPLVAELDLPTFDHTDPALSGSGYRAAMAGLSGYDGWLAAGPFGSIVLDRESGEFFLRTKDAVFPGLTIGQLFGIDDGRCIRRSSTTSSTSTGTTTGACATS